MKMASRLNPTEADYQRTIVEAAKLHGWFVHAERPSQTKTGRWLTAIQGKPGFPDLVLVHPRRSQLAFIELKRGRNLPTNDQWDWILALSQILGLDSAAVLFMPDDLQRCLDFLAGLRPLKPDEGLGE